jgi:hypothetical protein
MVVPNISYNAEFLYKNIMCSNGVLHFVYIAMPFNKISCPTRYCHLVLVISKFSFCSRFSNMPWKHGKECQLS